MFWSARQIEEPDVLVSVTPVGSTAIAIGFGRSSDHTDGGAPKNFKREPELFATAAFAMFSRLKAETTSPLRFRVRLPQAASGFPRKALAPETPPPPQQRSPRRTDAIELAQVVQRGDPSLEPAGKLANVA